MSSSFTGKKIICLNQSLTNLIKQFANCEISGARIYWNSGDAFYVVKKMIGVRSVKLL